MALYFGEEKVKINFDRIISCLNCLPVTPIISSIRTLSSDGYELKDSNELYLIPKEDD